MNTPSIYNEDLCTEKHDRVDSKLLEHTEKLNDHETKINNLTTNNAAQDSQINNLCDKIEKLISQNNKWFYALCVGMASILVKLLFFK